MADENIIESFEYYDYRAPISININATFGTEFPIHVYNEEIVTQPSKSFLTLTGYITALKTMNDQQVRAVPRTDFSTINNAFLHIFDRIDYYLGDTRIDTVRKPGISCTMKGLVSFDDDFRINDACWKIKNPDTEVLNTEGYFQVAIPLSTIMGVFEDFKQFLYKIPQRLVFTKSTVPDTEMKFIKLLHETPGFAVSYTLTDLIWRVPQIKLSLQYESRLRSDILKNKTYEMKYRTWHYESISNVAGSTFMWDLPCSKSRVKYILIGFQTNDGTGNNDNASEFALCELQNLQVTLNNNSLYPRERLNLHTAENKAASLYYLFKNFKISYYNDLDEDTIRPLVDYNTFLSKYPVIAIDCSYVPDVIKESLINIKINFEWRAPFAAANTIHCLMIMDSKTVYNPLHNTVISNQ